MRDYQKLYGILGLATKAGKLVAGNDACIEEIEKRNVKLLVMAKDASDRTKKQFQEKCQEYKVPIYEVLSIQELSKAIGKNNKAMVGIKEKRFAQAVENIISGGEVIG